MRRIYVIMGIVWMVVGVANILAGNTDAYKDWYIAALCLAIAQDVFRDE